MKNKIIQVIIFIIFVFTAIYLVNKQSNLINDKKILENNIEVLNDSIKTEINKVGELQFEKSTLISDKENLKSLNKDLFNEVNKQKGDVLTLSRINAKIKLKNEELEKALNKEKSKGKIEEVNDSTYNLVQPLYYEYDSLNFDSYIINTFATTSNGKINTFDTKIEERISSISVTSGYIYEDGKIKLILSTKYPMKLTQMDSYVDLDNKAFKRFKKPKKWGIGVGVGYNIKGELLPYIGIQRNLIRF